MIRFTPLLLLSVLLVPITATSFKSTCTGTATYRITFFNFLSRRFFGKLIPSAGLVFSPLTAVTHSNRISLLTVRGFASPEIEAIAETGDNAPLIRTARMLRRQRRGVKTIAAATGPTMPGNRTTLQVMVDCEHPFVTVVSMIAPSPDWIVQISNYRLVSMSGAFVRQDFGHLIAYDGGTDSGRNFTDPADLSLDMPTEPPLNIAPLVEDETDRFRGRFVGRFFVQRVK